MSFSDPNLVSNEPARSRLHLRRWVLFLLATVVLAVCCVGLSASSGQIAMADETKTPQAKDDADEFYFINLIPGSRFATQERFSDDGKVYLEGQTCGGMVTIYLNGSPIKIASHGGVVHRATEWVREGDNQVTIRGDHSEPFYVKVVTMRKQHLKGPVTATMPVVRTVSKRMFRPGVRAEPIEFRIERLKKQNTAFERLPVENTERIASEKEVRLMMGQFYDSLAKRDAAAVVNFFSRRSQLPTTSWLVFPEGESALRVLYRELLADESFTVIGDPKDLKVIWGERSILIYSAVEDDESSAWGIGAYSYRMRSKGFGQAQADPIQFVRIDGEWLLWM